MKSHTLIALLVALLINNSIGKKVEEEGRDLKVAINGLDIINTHDPNSRQKVLKAKEPNDNYMDGINQKVGLNSEFHQAMHNFGEFMHSFEDSLRGSLSTLHSDINEFKGGIDDFSTSVKDGVEDLKSGIKSKTDKLGGGLKKKVRSEFVEIPGLELGLRGGMEGLKAGMQGLNAGIEGLRIGMDVLQNAFGGYLVNVDDLENDSEIFDDELAVI